MKRFFATFLALGALALAQKPNTAVTGYTDTPEIPGRSGGCTMRPVRSRWW